MVKISARTEFHYMPQLFHIPDSQNGCSSPEMIDYSRNLDHRTSFDEECRRIQYEADISGSTIDRSLIPEDMRTTIQGRRRSPKAYHQSLTSPEMPFNRAASLGSGTVHIFADTKFEANPFSQALKVLNSDRDLIMKILSPPNCLLQTECETLTSASEAKHFLQKINHQQSNKTATKNGKSSGKKIACSCSLEQSTSRQPSRSRTSFSVREMKRKLKHALGSRRRESNSNHVGKSSSTSGKIFGHDCIYHGVETKSPLSGTSNAKVKEKLGRNKSLKVQREPHVAWETDTARGKIDLPARLRRVINSSHEIDSCLSPRRESQYCSASAPMRSSEEVMYDGTDEEIQDGMISPTSNMKCIDMPNSVETKITLHSELDYDTMISNAETAARIIKSYRKYGSLLHSVMNSITVDCSPSSPTCINTKNQEEHLSPVSVLDQFFADEYSSTSTTASQSARDPLKARRLHFEENTLASSSQVPRMDKQNETISNYVHVIMEASSIDWDQLSAKRPLSEHLLHPSLFDETQFLLSDPHFDTRLLFDHVNEILLEAKRSHFGSLYWPSLVKPRVCCLPLEEIVIDEIMREAQFYLLPRTEKRTLDQLVAKDLSGSRLQLDVRPEIEEIIIHFSEDILEESILDVILQLHS